MKNGKQTKRENIIFIAGVACAVILAAFMVFPGLDYGGLILEWDEARHGVNAYEMLQSKNYIVNTYQYAPDYWNTKPPLSMWVIMLGYKIFGFNVIGLRFFSALCLPVSVFVTMLVLKRYTGVISAVVSGISLAVCGGRLPHLFTTGDPDALFFLFCLSACLFLYSACKEKSLYLLGTGGICTALAFLTKSLHVVSLFFVSAAYLALVIKNRVFSKKQILTCLVLPMAVPVAVWAALRFSYDGLEFFKRMFIADMFNRVTSVVEGHSGGASFYADVFSRFIGTPSIIAFILLLAVWVFDRVSEKFINGNKNIPDLDIPFIFIFSAMAVGPFIIFTLSVTKIAWYIYPSLIGFCFIAGYAAQNIFTRLSKKKGNALKIIYLCALTGCLLCCWFIKPYEGSAASYTTNVNSGNNVFSALDAKEGLRYIAVDANGEPANLLISWLLQSYFSGMEYVPGGMGDLNDGESTLVALRCADENELNSFLEKYPGYEVVNHSLEYTGAAWVLLK